MASEAQEEEREVLVSIYESDPAFRQIGPETFHYRVGDVGQPKSFLVEVTWPSGYPDELPSITLDSFFNNHLSPGTKQAIVTTLEQEASVLLGSPMTYSLFEYARDNVDEMAVDVKESQNGSVDAVGGAAGGAIQSDTRHVKEKKEHLSKQAKRRRADRTNAKGERARGWDWVDIIKLSKTGSS